VTVKTVEQAAREFLDQYGADAFPILRERAELAEDEVTGKGMAGHCRCRRTTIERVARSDQRSACSPLAVIANARPLKYIGPRLKLVRQRQEVRRPDRSARPQDRGRLIGTLAPGTSGANLPD
jgi:hypothetical protein